MIKTDKPVVAVVVAAGSGSRLGGQIKSLREIGGRPLVDWAVSTMYAAGADQVVLVAPADRVAEFADKVSGRPTVVAGGKTRDESVRCGLAAITVAGDPIVLVHDAARPLTPVAVCERVIAAVSDCGGAVVPVVTVADSIRQVDADGRSRAVDRQTLRAVQTPQGMRLSVLEAGHRVVAERGLAVTDDAQAAHAAGFEVTLVAGAAEAMKVTTAVDLAAARELYAQRQESR